METTTIDYTEQIEKSLEAWLPETTTPPGLLHEAMRYSIFAGGKRLRPRLVLASAETLGGDPYEALAPAAALEMIHTYSLIHDDLPAMDDDDLRRGRPTSHKAYGEDFAILAGDGLLTQAFYILSTETAKVEHIPALVKVISEKAGWAGMVGGQVADIATGKTNKQDQIRGLDHVKFNHLKKTAALISASVECGAICAGVSEETQKRYAQLGQTLGLGFQIIDDILDVTADSATLGKTAGKDERDNKLTYPSIIGVDKSRKMALAFETEIMDTLASDGYLDSPLQRLVQKCIHREF
jgi:geranylgeranyl diphosphate synthase type II